MPEREPDGIIYYRGKGDALGAVIVGLILVVFAVIVINGEGLAGIPFSRDLTMLATYLALPLGAVLFLAHIWHVMGRGPTMVAGKEGITVLYTPKAIGPIRWAEVAAFKPFKRNGHDYLGVTLENPAQTLYPYRRIGLPLLTLSGPKEAHMKIKGKMLDDHIENIAEDLEEMRQVHTWKR